MDTREFPILDDDGLVERLAVGLGDDAARVLAYLLRRRGTDRFGDDPATRLAVRVGTGLNRECVAAALTRLEDRNLVTATTLQNDGRGRPPTAWHTAESVTPAVRRVHGRHATALLEQTRTVATALGADPFDPADGVDPFQTTGTDPNDDPNPFRLGLNWRPNPLHAPFSVAAATGVYDDAGVEVAREHFRGSGRALRSLVEGTTDVALAGAATTLRAREENGVLPVAVVFQRAMAALYTTREAFGGTFETVEQLRGRRVGLSRTSETGVLVQLFLSQAGVLDDVTVVDITGEERAALDAGRAAAVAGSFADPRRLEAIHTVDSVVVADRFPMYGPALVATETTLRERPSALQRFLAGTVAGWAAALADPAAAVGALGTDEPADESTDEGRTFEYAVEHFGGGSAVADNGWGWQTVAGWDRLVTALDRTDLLAGVTP